jgi:hypothetical protein
MMKPSQKLNYDMINDRGFDSVHHQGVLHGRTWLWRANQMDEPDQIE